MGVPTWSSTTRITAPCESTRTAVATKLGGVAECTQAVRTTSAEGWAASTATSPSRLVRAYTPCGVVGAWGAYGAPPRPSNT